MTIRYYGTHMVVPMSSPIPKCEWQARELVFKHMTYPRRAWLNSMLIMTPIFHSIKDIDSMVRIIIGLFSNNSWSCLSATWHSLSKIKLRYMMNFNKEIFLIHCLITTSLTRAQASQMVALSKMITISCQKYLKVFIRLIQVSWIYYITKRTFMWGKKRYLVGLMKWRNSILRRREAWCKYQVCLKFISIQPCITL